MWSLGARSGFSGLLVGEVSAPGESAAEPGWGHVVFYCPTSGWLECCPVDSGWDRCCDRPDLHMLGWDGALTPGERETPS
jgi:hypothetical protein